MKIDHAILALVANVRSLQIRSERVGGSIGQIEQGGIGILIGKVGGKDRNNSRG